MKPYVADRDRPNRTAYAAICAGAVPRLLWAAGALAVLWITVHWALS